MPDDTTGREYRRSGLSYNVDESERGGHRDIGVQGLGQSASTNPGISLRLYALRFVLILPLATSGWVENMPQRALHGWTPDVDPPFW